MFFGLFLFLACFDKIEISEYGLLYNTWTMQIYKEPRSPGRFFLGLGKKFVRYPRNLMDFEFKDSSSGNVRF